MPLGRRYKNSFSTCCGRGAICSSFELQAHKSKQLASQIKRQIERIRNKDDVDVASLRLVSSYDSRKKVVLPAAYPLLPPSHTPFLLAKFRHTLQESFGNSQFNRLKIKCNRGGTERENQTSKQEYKYFVGSITYISTKYTLLISKGIKYLFVSTKTVGKFPVTPTFV